mmetsp:Transcript_89039/g.229736  ORF Transcript_89039/g.229736 Transcript_89039/m.229736 type:complete len:533 (-) Transcript_89039:105-1703(-)
MGAGAACHNEFESDASSSEASQPDSDTSDGESADMPSLFMRMAGCIRHKTGFHFSKSEDLKVAVAKKNAVPSKALLINNVGKHLDKYFDIDKSKCLGEGGYATVSMAQDKRTCEQRAVKCIQKALVADRSRLQGEIDIVMSMDHPNINKLFQTFEDRRYIYLILELCQGGELFDRIIEEGQLSEALAATIMQQVFRAVHYMHQNGVCHRDLKPENFLFQHKAPIEGNTLKLIDFGIATTFRSPNDTFSTKTGTPYYVAPEVLSYRGTYGKEVDMWACGIIMYVLLSGRLPFKGKDEASTLHAVMLGKFHFPSEKFSKVSGEAKHLVRRLLARKPTDRCTSGEALEDAWTKNTSPAAAKADVQPQIIRNLESFRMKHKLHKAALHAVARQLDEELIKELRNIFMQMDTNSDGTLTVEEIISGLQQEGIQLPLELRGIVEAIDSDGSGEIDYTEFLAATLERRQYIDEDVCWSAFRIFDQNDDGCISRNELQAVLANGNLRQVMGKDIDDLMKQVDADGDGYISFDEFMIMMRK